MNIENLKANVLHGFEHFLLRFQSTAPATCPKPALISTHAATCKEHHAGHADEYKIKKCPMSSKCPGSLTPATKNDIAQLDDGWPESEKDVFQAALRMVVVKDSR